MFEAISVGVWKALDEEKALKSLDKEAVKVALSSTGFRQCTYVANELHKKQKLQGRVMYIYNLVSTGGGSYENN